MTLGLNRKRPGRIRPQKRLYRGAGAGFGLSREKEAAGAASVMSLAMGFECRLFAEGFGKTRLAECCEWVLGSGGEQDRSSE